MTKPVNFLNFYSYFPPPLYIVAFSMSLLNCNKLPSKFWNIGIIGDKHCHHLLAKLDGPGF